MVSCSSGHVAEEDIELGPFLYVPPQGGEYTLALLGLVSLHCRGVNAMHHTLPTELRSQPVQFFLHCVPSKRPYPTRLLVPLTSLWLHPNVGPQG